MSGTKIESSLGDELVEIATELLDADVCELLVEDGDRLIVTARSPARPSDATSYPVLTGIPGGAFRTGTACVIDDALDTRSTASTGQASSPSTEYRSVCCVPIENLGLFQAKSYRPHAFTETDKDRLERLAAVAAVAFSHSGIDSLLRPNGGRDEHSLADRLEEIADILSHDLKTPLSVIKGNLELAREVGDEEYFESAAAGLDRLEGLIDEVILLARTGDLVEHTEPVDLEDRARAAWQNIHTHNATLEIEGSFVFQASKRGVSHMLENMMENAVTHAGPTATVRVGGIVDGFYIEDDGPGISEQYRDQIFDRGYTIDTGTSGIGLHIVKQIATAHGWTLTVGESTSGGTRFEITGVDIGTY